MADADDGRRLALAQPQVVGIDSDGLDFRLGAMGVDRSIEDPE